MERRSLFRFRLPWSQPAPTPSPTPASKSSSQPKSKTSSSSATRPGRRSQTVSESSSSNTRPSSSPKTGTPTRSQPPSTSSTTTSPAQTLTDTQARNEGPTITTIPTPTSEINAASQPSTISTSPLAETTPIPQSSSPPMNTPAIPKSETGTPTTSITTKPTSATAQSPQSSPPGVAPTRTEPASPPSPSPSRSAPQSLEMTPTPSPTHRGPQDLSADQHTSKASTPAKQISSSNLPSDITPQMQPKDQPTSPLKQPKASSVPSSKSSETLPLIPGESEQVELLHQKEVITNKGVDAKVRSPERVMYPSEPSEVKSNRGFTERPSQISNSSEIIGEHKRGIEETKDVKEVMQEKLVKKNVTGEKIGRILSSKEQPSVVFQSKQVGNPSAKGKQTRTTSSQLKNKTVVSDSSKEAEHGIPLNKEINDNISNLIHRMSVGDGKRNLEEGPVNVITLAGDNRGASMQLGSDSSGKKGAIHINRGYKMNQDQSSDTSTDAEVSSEGKDQQIEAYLNCNVQGLNNSITSDSFVEGRNPGIHMSLPRMPSEPIKTSERKETFEANRSEFNVTPAQKLTHRPVIRRRCVRGLFPELSAYPDDPEKSMKHSCEVGCMENEIDIL